MIPYLRYTGGGRGGEKGGWDDVQVTRHPSAPRGKDPAPSRRVVVVWPVPAAVGALVGMPGWSGLASVLGAERDGDVIERTLCRALAVPARSEVVS